MARRAEAGKQIPEKAAREAAPAAPVGALAALGIFGWRALEPVVVAALATKEPVLLIGPHGTAKSLLLNRLAQALGLLHRHYNASLLNFDDLVGYPVPSVDRARLVYVPTASSIWDAESVLFDEISRCRIDLQNKLFPIIHERVVQGLKLPNLRYRWAAMNPPAPPDVGNEEDEGTDIYRGSEPLDPALADRFPFVLEAPDFRMMSDAERRAVIGGASDEPGADAAARLRLDVDTVGRCLPAVRRELCAAACDYVSGLLPLLEKMRRQVSPRRARYLHDAVVAVHAARACADASCDPGESAYLALRCAIPHPATGRLIDGAKLLAAHRQAWALARLPRTDPARLVLSEPDPVRRVGLGLRVGLGTTELSAFVLDAYADLPPAKRVLFAAALYPVVSTRVDLTATAFEAIAEVQAHIEDRRERNHDLVPGSRRFELWREVTHVLAGLMKETAADRTLHNALLVAFERDEEDFGPASLVTWFRELVELFGWSKEASP